VRSSVPHKLPEKPELTNRLAGARGATSDIVGGSSGSGKGGKMKVGVGLTRGKADAEASKGKTTHPQNKSPATTLARCSIDCRLK
jgi:hypothetical protein